MPHRAGAESGTGLRRTEARGRDTQSPLGPDVRGGRIISLGPFSLKLINSASPQSELRFGSS